jgi:(p)ppGpp synthase/HD superfamily hydrolase
MTKLQNHVYDNLDLKKMDGSLLAFAILNNVKRIKGIDEAVILHAMEFASYIHRKDTRRNRENLPRDNYITHPYRNTLRLIRYGCVSQNVLVASILHDTAEDHPSEIIDEFSNYVSTDYEDDVEKLKVTIKVIGEIFGKRVAELVDGVSNVPLPKGTSKALKREKYAEHVLLAIQDPEVFLIKFSDFVDNAVGLYHNTGAPDMVFHLTTKYLLLVDAFRKRIHHARVSNEFNLTREEGYDEIFAHLDLGEKRLKALNEA